MATDADKFNKDDLIVDKFKDFKIGGENDHDWSLNFTQKNGYKLYSNGYCYVLDKPKRELVAEASRIYWRCEFYHECGGRGVSSGLKPPFKETKKHNEWHKSKPESKEYLDSKILLNGMIKNSHEPPRAIIRQFQLGLSDNCIRSWPKK